MADLPGPIAALDGSPGGQCLNGVCNLIIDLDLDGIGGNVWIRDPPNLKYSNGKVIPLPAVILSPGPPSHTPSDGTATAPDLIFRTMVGIVGNDTPGVVNAGLANRLLWHHQIFKRFAKEATTFDLSSPGNDGVAHLGTTVEPGGFSIIEAAGINYYAEYLVICHWLRYPSTA